MRRVHYGDSSQLCGTLVTYKHLPGPRRCKKPKHHQGACWGGTPVPPDLSKLPIDAASKWRWRARIAERKVKRLRKWLEDARWELQCEVDASGPEEVKENPHLSGKQKLVDRIAKALEETK